jgi:hypothetical protein
MGNQRERERACACLPAGRLPPMLSKAKREAKRGRLLFGETRRPPRASGEATRHPPRALLLSSRVLRSPAVSSRRTVRRRRLGRRRVGLLAAVRYRAMRRRRLSPAGRPWIGQGPRAARAQARPWMSGLLCFPSFLSSGFFFKRRRNPYNVTLKNVHPTRRASLKITS